MNEKLAKVKKNLKHHVPEIIVLASAAVGVASAIYLLKNQKREDLIVAIPPEAWDALSSGYSTRFAFDDGTLLYLAKEYHF